MSFNRSLYDPCEYNKRLSESNNVLTYNINPNKFYNNNEYSIPLGVVGGNAVSLSGCNLVDVESELRNQTRVYSTCPQFKYKAGCAGNCTSRSG